MTRENRPETASPEGRLSSQEMERFTECVLPYLDAAHNLARYLVRDPHEAEEAVQESFLRAIPHFDGFRGVDGRGWLLSIARNTCFTQLHRRRTLHPSDPGPRRSVTRACRLGFAISQESGRDVCSWDSGFMPAARARSAGRLARRS